MRARERIEEIEALWLDRRLHALHDSLFDDLGFVEELALDAAEACEGRDRHPLGYLPRVVVDDPSERLLRTADYLPVGSVMIGGPFGSRLVLRPCVADDAYGYVAALDASECYAAFMRRLLEEGDGVVRVVSFPPGRLAWGRPLRP